MTAVQVQLPGKLTSVFEGDAMYRGAYGGRGSAKSRSFAKMAAAWGVKFAEADMGGQIVCGREFQNSLDDSSLAEVKAAIESEPWLSEHYEVGEKFIRTKDGRIEFTFTGLRHNIASIKSKARIRLLWIDEAEQVSEAAYMVAIPTVREEDAEIWLTWNPQRKASATDKRFRLDPPAGSKIIQMNWRDNPWFPTTLARTRIDDQKKRPDQYEHVWEGAYATAHVGAYFASALSEAQRQGRIGRVAKDPLMATRAFWDIGGTGAKADACSIWIAQFISREIRVLDYYEAQGEPLATHVAWLREKWPKAICILPHDGATNDRVHDVSFESALRSAGFDVPPVIPNQGRGAARMRVEAARRLFPMVWFNGDTTEAGRDALGWYHEKRSDDERDVGLGPEHDWCLAAGTAILTPSGWRQVESLQIGDMVITPRGWRRILRSGIVRRTNEWVTVKGIRCTPEHRFFTSRGLVEASNLLSLEKLWTRDDWGLRILACLFATRSFGLKIAITSATPEINQEVRGAVQCSFTGWFMRLFMDRCRKAMRSITSMMTRSITIPTTLRPCLSLPIGAVTNQSLATFALAECAGESLAAISNSAIAAVPPVSAKTAPASNGNAAPAYNLTVDVDECYFVRGDDGRAYLVSNSSHAADAFGLMCVAYEAPAGKSQKLKYPNMAYA